ncbi:MAG: GFA family protein [Proteobacteria bacterium]|nr:GFA family protein [Pseudomonadota bacterium]
MVTGSCLCGRFAFELDGPLKFMSHCHCSFCRKVHGAAFATYAGAPAAGFRWRSGEGEQSRYASSKTLERPFCPTCGSKVPGSAEGELLFLPMGLLDGDPGARAEAHIFAASKPAWDEINDGLPAFDAAPPGYPDPNLEAPPRPAEATPGAIAGSCLCGGVAWEQSQPPWRMGHCHCSRCRKLRGAAFSTQVFAEHGQFRWLRGREEVQEFQLPGAAFFGNSFCGQCASPVPRDFAEAPAVLIPAGPLDDDPITRPMAHIYVASKAPWFEIADGLPQFDEMPPGG